MERYSRNYNSISKENQLTLYNSVIAIIGLGGLGGYVLENLVRLGIGSLHIIDHDIFNKSNLNRQILSTEENIGCSKVIEAKKRAKSINSKVKVKMFNDKLNRNSEYMLDGVDVVVDCLDSIESRIELELLCDKLGLPLIHGAIDGYLGQVSLSCNGNRLFDKIYKDPMIDTSMGNLPMTCMVVASLQVTLLLKLLFGESLDNEFYYFNLKDYDFTKLILEPRVDNYD